MAAVNRSAVITKLHKVLKKHYQPVVPAAGRSMLENMLFAWLPGERPLRPGRAGISGP